MANKTYDVFHELEQLNKKPENLRGTINMTENTIKNLEEFRKLTDTEEYLQFFDIAYDQKFVNINRLHILKQFSILIEEIDKVFPDVSESERLDKYASAFEEAYQLFVTSSPLETKLFKVFQETPKNVVLLEDVNTTDAGVK